MSKLFYLFFYLIFAFNCNNIGQYSLQEEVQVENKQYFFKIETINEPVKKYISHDSINRFIARIKDTVSVPKSGKPFNSLKFNRVVAFEFFGGHEQYFVIKNRNQYVEKIKELTQNQVNELSQLFSNKKSYGNVTAACFDPHLCICFFNNTTCVMEISICMSCNYLRSTVNIPAVNNNKRIGFSISTQKKLKTLCNSLGYKSYDFSFN